MKSYFNPPKELWNDLIKRAPIDFLLHQQKVGEVMIQVKENGDKAVIKYTGQFDKVDLEELKVTTKELELAIEETDSKLKNAIQTAARNITLFHETQITTGKVISTSPGVKCWQKSKPIEKVGLYVPGGSAPLFSTVLMLAIPARIAGCKEIILCTPPGQNGKIHPAILYTASLCGVTNIFKAGGIQAIAAMAIGTESIPKVDKIFGPGNSWVMAAKQYAALHFCAIDMPAGPSEVAVMADNCAHPAFVASDLLSQAEHGPDSQVLLVTTDSAMLEKVKKEISKQIKTLPRSAIAMQALENSRLILMENEDLMVELINEYAPEHLIIATKNANLLADRITNAGSVFIGHYTPESAGDYASGTNHTLPTSGWARSFSGVSTESFCKKITYQEITKTGLKNLGPIIETMAEAEQLFAHRNAVTIRLSKK